MSKDRLQSLMAKTDHVSHLIGKRPRKVTPRFSFKNVVLAEDFPAAVRVLWREWMGGRGRGRFENRHFIRSQGLRVQLPPNHKASRARKGAEKKGSRGRSSHATRRGKRGTSIAQEGSGRQATAPSGGPFSIEHQIRCEPDVCICRQVVARERKGERAGGKNIAAEEARWTVSEGLDLIGARRGYRLGCLWWEGGGLFFWEKDGFVETASLS